MGLVTTSQTIKLTTRNALKIGISERTTQVIGSVGVSNNSTRILSAFLFGN